jgi:DNA-binding transcriptional ArsR family regulator
MRYVRRVLPHPLPAELAELIARRFRAIGDATRIRILDRLQDGEASVQELTALVGSTQQNVSKHLGVLAAAGIVARRRQGGYTLYRVADDGVYELCRHVCGSLERQLDELEALVRAPVP